MELEYEDWARLQGRGPHFFGTHILSDLLGTTYLGPRRLPVGRIFNRSQAIDYNKIWLHPSRLVLTYLSVE